MKNLLIIGGSYFVGRVFVEELSHYPEYAVSVMNRGNRPLRLEGIEEIVCDRHHTAQVSRALPAREWHAVVDFCAYEPADIAGLLENLPGPVEEYVYISTASVYQNSLTLPMNEDTPKLAAPLPVPGGDYAYKKWLTELKHKELCEKKGIAYVALRPTFIYGKYNYAPRESYFFNLMAKGEPIILPPPPQGLFNMVSVWDVARICIACLGNQKVFNHAYTVCNDELVSYDRIIEVLESITSKKLNIRRQPVSLIEAGKLPLPFPLKEHLIYSGSLLQRTLNYQYLSFAEGMARTWDWFFKEKESAALAGR